MATTAEPASEPTGEYTHAQILTIMSGLMLGMFLGALDQTIVSTAIRTIADDLNGLSIQAWATTAYLITMTITTPIYGKLGDLYGRKKLFMFAISIFVIGSALCTLATSMYSLAVYRAIQGLGAGGLFTLVLAIIGDVVSPRERAKYSGYFMAVFGTSSVLGPVIGGFLAGQDTLLGMSGWRWVFLVNVPIGAIALFVVFRTLHVHHDAPDHRIRIDWWGALALVVGLVPLLTVAEQGREWGWDSGRSLACFVVGGIGLVAFFLVERVMKESALFPLRLLRLRAVSVTVVASIVIGAAMFGGILVLPLYMQIVHGASPTESGFLMLPMVLGIMSAAMGSGIAISRTGNVRPFPIVGSALVVVGLFALSFTTADTALWLVMVPMFVLGFGLGNCMQPLLLAVQSAVSPREIGVATSSATFFRQIGGTLGVAVFLSVLFSTVGGNIETELDAAASSPEFQAAAEANGGFDPSVVASVQDDSSVLSTLPDALAHPIRAGFATSMDQVFLVASGVAVIAFLVLLLMPRVELRATSAAAERGARTAPAGE
ncbi:MDR family MFS transporter [Nocardioides bruguierae]|uniref:MFS transporter n=1 Tax=Nocardioides bruguierae TaxID=2945102 RepID=A0A9X2IDH8_9ACTN|nr:MDR family MFS transporter [Nocardioides bruguierae]MCL8026490.1 MFS transporter [Nocardioides bruguierae]MCM0619776.1 MFS transporter [Nocardioides bruguierae]